jgi:hypothetical protein
MSSRNEMIPIECEFVHETELALIVNCGEPENVVLAKSLIEYDEDEDLVRGEPIELLVPRWKAEQEGIE